MAYSRDAASSRCSTSRAVQPHLRWPHQGRLYRQEQASNIHSVS